MSPRLVMTVAAATLAGCAVDPYAHAPIARHVERDDDVGACARLFRETDAVIDAQGARDAQAPRVPGFPYLRVDRFTASLGPEAVALRAFSPWSELMAQLDREARRVELANAGAAARDLRPAALDGCRYMLGVADNGRLPELAAAAKVPDDYSTALRALGLYPLIRLAFVAGIADWQTDTRAVFALPLAQLPVHGELERYVPAADAAPPAVLDAIPRSGTFDFPVAPSARWRQWITRHAPVLVIDTASDADRPGALQWRRDAAADDARLAVATAQPVAYVRIAYARLGGRVRVQLVYTFWFPARPAEGAFDVLAGHLDGLLWRVTLDANGDALVYDSIHPCGCYHQFFPTGRVRARPQADTLDETLFAPQTVRSPGVDERIELRVASRTHYLQRVGVIARDAIAATEYALRDDGELRALPLPAGGTRSAFGADGLVPGSERAERYFFWPMGIASAGQMRQWGTHATAFVGRRHFDDADLFERYFEVIEPGDAGAPLSLRGSAGGEGRFVGFKAPAGTSAIDGTRAAATARPHRDALPTIRQSEKDVPA